MYQRYVATDRSQRHYVWVGRGIVAALLFVAYALSVSTFDFLVVLVTLSGSGALQLMPAILGVCFPGRRTLTRAGVLAGLAAGLVSLYLTLLDTYVSLGPMGTLEWEAHPLGIHGGIWSLLVNAAVALNVSAFTRRPTDETILRIHGEVERYVYGDQ